MPASTFCRLNRLDDFQTVGKLSTAIIHAVFLVQRLFLGLIDELAATRSSLRSSGSAPRSTSPLSLNAVRLHV